MGGILPFYSALLCVLLLVFLRLAFISEVTALSVIHNNRLRYMDGNIERENAIKICLGVVFNK